MSSNHAWQHLNRVCHGLLRRLRDEALRTSVWEAICDSALYAILIFQEFENACIWFCSQVTDLSKTSWVQRAFNNEFSASGYWRLYVHELRIMKTRSAKIFTCRGIMEDGTELYRHHVITAKIGISVYIFIARCYQYQKKIESGFLMQLFSECTM